MDDNAILSFAGHAVRGDVAAVLDALRSGMSPDIDLGAWGGPSLLCLISGKKNAPMVKILTDHGADPNRELRGQTPLVAAAMVGAVEVIEVLVAAGANPSLRTSTGDSPLYVACNSDQALAARRLVELGANPDALHPNASGVTDRMVCAYANINLPQPSPPPAFPGTPLKPPDGKGTRGDFEGFLKTVSPETLNQMRRTLPLLVDQRVGKGEITPERAAALKQALSDFDRAAGLPDLEDRAVAMKSVLRRFVELFGKPEMFG